MSFAVSDNVNRVLGLALDGVSLRQSVIADNIANVDTPDFRASSVDFESSLRGALESGDVDRGRLSGIEAVSTATDTPVGPNGNNVDLRKETLAAVQTQYQYQLLSRAVSDRHALLRSALGSM
ncbi:flagellar basal-body rod protein FlgB [Nocardioides scoriae]|uniref:Flagellar basal body rod protein FlgB n=1 Tax=Nocardioides scoriae TaxID=642780 RepID=A0A1H1S5S3_9ACTN|nr:flagellar basal body rod protein FlgB [Nocardioides scoriae]SDS43324.1 flagellar basal-body rod protein FlgB [Nocardioides scoriae]